MGQIFMGIQYIQYYYELKNESKELKFSAETSDNIKLV